MKAATSGNGNEETKGDTGEPEIVDPRSLVTCALEGPPDMGLAAVARLRSLVDDWERSQVERARALGWNWAEIARILGRHRQAVHREYAKVLGPSK